MDGDRELAREALRRKAAGERPTAHQALALGRFERARERDLRWKYYSAIPKGDWKKLSGRQWKILNEQAALYGIPIGEKTIDLQAVATWVHDMLAKYGRLILAAEEDPLMGGGNSPATERFRLAKAELAEMDLAERQDHLVRVEVMHDMLTRVTGLLRSAGDTLQRECGPEAGIVLGEALDNAEREIATYFEDQE